MNKNYIKVLGLSAITGWVISKVYDLGINQGKQELAVELKNMLDEAIEVVNETK